MMPLAVSAVTLETTDVSVKLYANGSHHDENFDINSGIDIGGFLDIYAEGSCIIFVLTYPQYDVFINETAPGVPLEGEYSYMAEAIYNEGPTYWNYTIPEDFSNWFFVFYKSGGSGGAMTVNASIWDWDYVHTETYPTNTSITPTNTTITTTTTIYPTTTTTIEPPVVIDLYGIGIATIVLLGLCGTYWIMNQNKPRWE